MTMDTKAVREMLKARHELDEKIVGPNMSSLAAIQTALLCDIADSLRSMVENPHARDGVFHVDMRQLGIDPRLIEEGIRRGVEMAMQESHRQRGLGEDMRRRRMGGPTIEEVMRGRQAGKTTSARQAIEDAVRDGSLHGQGFVRTEYPFDHREYDFEDKAKREEALRKHRSNDWPGSGGI